MANEILSLSLDRTKRGDGDNAEVSELNQKIEVLEQEKLALIRENEELLEMNKSLESRVKDSENDLEKKKKVLMEMVRLTKRITENEKVEVMRKLEVENEKIRFFERKHDAELVRLTKELERLERESKKKGLKGSKQQWTVGRTVATAALAVWYFVYMVKGRDRELEKRLTQDKIWFRCLECFDLGTQ